MRASRETENSRPAHDPLPTERAWLEGRSRVTGEPWMVRRLRPWNRLTSRGTVGSSPHGIPRSPILQRGDPPRSQGPAYYTKAL
ncbi:hypothetical protein NDU88_003478 [Pleurodeles waltl]|uniref:Uncharacterized protein n=1 Tax=Pleurodeles waltl TaxID=8319 RepID=A0AAV7RIB8_PLEWA|nr:hypothetical protein NDU88_003478 [Pleurodeles waltl]